jgi:hypothetical protein
MRNGLKVLMKRVLLFVSIIFALTACKKTVITPGLFGKWELRSEVGGIAGIDSTFKPGNGTVFQFNRDSTYQHYIKGKLYNGGTFRIGGSNLPTGNSTPEIFFNGNTSGEVFILSGTQITIGADYDDGIATGYQKIGN